MKIPNWCAVVIRKTSTVFHGTFELICEDGKVVGVNRRDFFNEEIARKRFPEVDFDSYNGFSRPPSESVRKPEEKERENGPTTTDGLNG